MRPEAYLILVALTVIAPHASRAVALPGAAGALIVAALAFAGAL